MLEGDEKKRILNRLRRIRGQVDAIGRMVEGDKECVEILMQISAINGALGRVGQLVMEDHVRTCLSDSMRNRDQEDREAQLKELVDVLRQYARALD